MLEDDDRLDDDDDELDEDTQKDKYLTFKIGREHFAIAIYYVMEIIGIQKITEVPDTQDYIKGVINLRGKVIPVIDIRLRFKLEALDYTNRTCIIVVNMNNITTGLIVDEVAEVIDILESQIDAPPQTTNDQKHRFISGLGKIEKNVKIILDVERMLNEKDISILADNA